MPEKGRMNAGFAQVVPRTKQKAPTLVVPHHPAWSQRAVGLLIYLAIVAVSRTIRIKYRDQAGRAELDRQNAILCTWHNRLPLCLKAYLEYLRPKEADQKIAALVSASRDGGFLTAILQRFGVQPVRGSSSRRGPQALLELTTWAGRGYDLAITPDGPRGPRYHFQAGPMALAQLTGLPIIPVVYNFSWKLVIKKSWDQFQIPLPFSRCECVVLPAVRVPREATDAQREEARAQLEASLREATRD